MSIFWIHFVYVQEKNGGKLVSVLCYILFYIRLIQPMTKIYKVQLYKALGRYSPMLYDLSVLIHYVPVWPFFRKLKSPGFSYLYRTPKRGRFCKKLVIIESLIFEFAEKYQTTVHYDLLKIRICHKRRSTLSVYY